MSAAMDVFPRDSKNDFEIAVGKRAIGVRAIESSTVHIDSHMSGMIHVQIQKSHKRNFFLIIKGANYNEINQSIKNFLSRSKFCPSAWSFASISAVLFETRRISRCRNTLFLSSLHFSFIKGFISDLFIVCDDSLMC